MKILYLGPLRLNVINYLKGFGDDVEVTEEPITATSNIVSSSEFIVSFGYRHILKNDIIDLFPMRIINLHISFLPWNKGADPNLWSFLENTPKGVTIHYIDAGLDTGKIIVQRELKYGIEDTLKTSYDKLLKTIEALFFQEWPSIRKGETKPFSQHLEGTYHRSKDRQKYLHLLTQGWDTPVHQLLGKANEIVIKEQRS
jgi:methionyl-tRNA formyltransferase